MAWPHVVDLVSRPAREGFARRVGIAVAGGDNRGTWRSNWIGRTHQYKLEIRSDTLDIQEDEHLLAVLRYIERNPLRTGLVERAEEWRWSSLRWLSAPGQARLRLEPGTAPRGSSGWKASVTADINLEIARESVRRDCPFGTSEWTLKTAKALNLESSIRPRGRPRSNEPAANRST
jgi:putative transposase